jgi:hypothetical protein
VAKECRQHVVRKCRQHVVRDCIDECIHLHMLPTVASLFTRVLYILYSYAFPFRTSCQHIHP